MRVGTGHQRALYLAVHHKVADASSEVFVLKLGIDVGQVLVDSAQLQHLRQVQVP